jgi:hypothetical protein
MTFKNPTHQAAYERGYRESRERRGQTDVRKLTDYDPMQRRAYSAGYDQALRDMELDLLRS